MQHLPLSGPCPSAVLQDRMHLDCVFSIVADDVCIMMDEMMGEKSPTKRLVDEWVQVSVEKHPRMTS